MSICSNATRAYLHVKFRRYVKPAFLEFIFTLRSILEIKELYSVQNLGLTSPGRQRGGCTNSKHAREYQLGRIKNPIFPES